MSKLQLTTQQLAFMDTFGYLAFPGLLSDRIERMLEEFENVFMAHGGGHNGRPHDGTARSSILPFVDQTDYLASLIDDPRIDGIFSSLLGEDYNYLVLRNEVAAFARFWVDSVYGDAMLRTANPARLVHLQQPLAQQDHLAEEVRKAKLTMKEPARW